VPTGFALHPSLPNPFNAGTTINYELPGSGHVRLVVYDILGQQVSVLATGRSDAGYFSTTWDGRDSEGRASASGVYVVVLQSTGGRLVRKMSLVR
jgi:flagellar hook assembly protein FlgD